MKTTLFLAHESYFHTANIIIANIFVRKNFQLYGIP
jgi:hypothetical protein